MTYRVGVAGPLAAYFPEFDAEPTLSCDIEGCGVRMRVKPGRGGGTPAWLRDKRAPAGWRRLHRGDSPAWHTCPRCSAAGLEPGVG
jgi:hypothetical protein